MAIPQCDAAACALDAAGLNRDCRCVSVDIDKLRGALEADPQTGSLQRLIAETRPYLFAQLPVFVAAAHIERMREVVHAAESVIRLPAYRALALDRAPPIARRDPGSRGVFMSYDFHLGEDGPQLIEINTNAGGALLNVALARAQRACCAEVQPLLLAPGGAPCDEARFMAMFREEWRRQREDRPLRRIAIVDDDPPAQYLWPEFLLFKQMFERAGYEATVADARSLVWADGALRQEGSVIDLVYNRLTDFYLEHAEHAALRAAYEAHAVVMTPHPQAHALYADKRNLVILSDAKRLEALGAGEAAIASLAGGVPRTVTVDAANAETLWAGRRRLFFKPIAGYGGRAAYRGDKLTQRVWKEIVGSGGYIAQTRVEPSDRRVPVNETLVDLKLDLRCYVYAGEIQLVAARLYQGQTTNFRTPGGGFAPVYTALG